MKALIGKEVKEWQTLLSEIQQKCPEVLTSIPLVIDVKIKRFQATGQHELAKLCKKYLQHILEEPTLQYKIPSL